MKRLLRKDFFLKRKCSPDGIPEIIFCSFRRLQKQLKNKPKIKIKTVGVSQTEIHTLKWNLFKVKDGVPISINPFSFRKENFLLSIELNCLERKSLIPASITSTITMFTYSFAPFISKSLRRGNTETMAEGIQATHVHEQCQRP